MENGDLQRTKETLKTLFRLMEIRRVICVDDDYRELETPQVEDIIGLCSEVDQKVVQDIPEFNTIPFDQDEELWKLTLKNLWGNISKERKNEIRKLLESQVNNSIYTDELALNSLEQIMKGIADFQRLSFKAWIDEKNRFIKEAQRDNTLFLIDQDLSKEEGRPNEGIHQIRNLLKSETKRNITCCLLSHTFPMADEYLEWNKLAQEHGIDKNRFMLIAKERLRESTGLSGFARMLKLTLLNRHCTELKEKVSKIIFEAQEEANKAVEEINIYDFEHIIFNSSFREGVWELDTLLRLYGIFHKTSVREKANKDKNIYNLSSFIRKVRDVPFENPENPPSETWKIQRRELYEEGEFINKLHMPLEIGDIFQKTNGGKIFILLAQPCDLMVRYDGKRHHSINEVVLAEIVEALPSDGNGNPTGYENHYELRYFDENKGKSKFVNFRKIYSVKLCVLDICVYNETGIAQISSTDNCPINVIPTWEKRFTVIKKETEKILKRYYEFQKQKMTRDILQLVLPTSSNNNLFRAKIETDKSQIKLSFDCRRIARVNQPHAGAILTKFANYMARSAFEHDIGR